MKLDGTENRVSPSTTRFDSAWTSRPSNCSCPAGRRVGIFDSAFVVPKTDARSTNELMSTRSSLNGAHVVLCNDDGHYNSASSYHHFDNLSGMTLRAGDSTRARLTSLQMNLVTSDGAPVGPETSREGRVYTFANGYLHNDVIHVATPPDNDAPVDTTEYRVRYAASSATNEKNVRGTDIEFHADLAAWYNSNANGAAAISDIAIRRRYGPHLILRVRMQV